MADVWLAKDHGPEPFSPDGLVALKVLRRYVAEDRTSLRRFELEGEAMIRFEHPNIARVFAAMNDGDEHFLVMEYIDGCSLAELLRERRSPLPPEDAVEVISQVCTGIEYAHGEGIIHRDVKPANVMLEGGYTEGTTPRVKVTDFGIARAKEGTRITRTRSVVGTPAYMAAEVARGGKANASSDVFACGALLYQLLTDTVPFDGEDLSEIVALQEAGPPEAPAALNPEVPETLSDATLVALRHRPEARYESVEKMRLATEAAWDGEDIGDFMPTRFLGLGEEATGPTLFRRRPRLDGQRSPYGQQEPWLPLLKFFATLGALLVLFAVVLRLTSVVVALPVWALAAAVLVSVVATALLRSPVFTANGAERAAARARMRSAARSVLRTLVIGSLAVYWGILGYHLTNTVRDGIDRQPAASHLWLEVGGALVWIAAALFPLKWLLRSPMRIGRLVALGAIVALVWTASAEVLPEAPEAVAQLFWSGRPSLQHRVSAEGKRWGSMLRNLDPRIRHSHPKALRRRLARSRNARLRALRRADTARERHPARLRARRWLKSMRHARHDWHQPRCHHPSARLLIAEWGARSICP